jgi:hypothetical protein
MSKSTRRRIRAIAILIIFLALAYAAFSTLKPEKSRTGITSEFKEADAHFREVGSLNKASVTIRSQDIGRTLESIGKIVEIHSLEKPLFKNIGGSFGAFIFRVRENTMPQIKDQLSGIGSILDWKEIVDSVYVAKKLSTEESILVSKRSDLANFDPLKRSYGTASSEKDQLINEIRKLENTVDILRNSNTSLLYIKAIPVSGGTKTPIFVKFARNLGLALLALVILTVILYYGTKLLIYLLSLLGVRGFSTGALGGGSQYGYGSYANRYYSKYGYGGGRRKVKRIYKDKPSTPKSEESEKKQDN